MKKKYTRRQIIESIKYWQKQLKTMNEDNNRKNIAYHILNDIIKFNKTIYKDEECDIFQHYWAFDPKYRDNLYFKVYNGLTHKYKYYDGSFRVAECYKKQIVDYFNNELIPEVKKHGIILKPITINDLSEFWHIKNKRDFDLYAYTKVKLNFEFDASSDKQAKEINDAIDFIKNGGKAMYQYGFSYKGAKEKQVSSQWALKELQIIYDNGCYKWNFNDNNPAFHNLSYINVNGEKILLFTELGENDLF